MNRFYEVEYVDPSLYVDVIIPCNKINRVILGLTPILHLLPLYDMLQTLC